MTAEDNHIRADNSKGRKIEDDTAMSKKRRIAQNEDGVAWGDASPSQQRNRDTFLYTGNTRARLKQSTIQPVTGVEWLSRKFIENLVKGAVDIGEWSKDASTWDEWEPEGARKRKCGFGNNWMNVTVGKQS